MYETGHVDLLTPGGRGGCMSIIYSVKLKVRSERKLRLEKKG